MIRRLIHLTIVTALVVGACGDDDAGISTTSEATTSSTSTTTTTAPPTTTTTTAPPTSTTSFSPPPPTTPNPELLEFAGLWRWPNTHTRYLELLDHGVIAVGDVRDDSLELYRLGEWDVVDGLMTIRFLQIGGTCPNEAVGYYEISTSGSNLVTTLITDECENRSRWLIGLDRTSRTWLPAQPYGT